MRISDWSSDVCSSDLPDKERPAARDGCGADRIALVGRQQFSSHRPRPGLLKNNIRLLLQTAGHLERPGVIGGPIDVAGGNRSEENTSEIQSPMRISYADFCLKQKTNQHQLNHTNHTRPKY